MERTNKLGERCSCCVSGSGAALVTRTDIHTHTPSSCERVCVGGNLTTHSLFVKRIVVLWREVCDTGDQVTEEIGPD